MITSIMAFAGIENERTRRLFLTQIQANMKTFFLVQYYCNISMYVCAEPVGMKAPTFSTDTKITAFVRNEGHSCNLLCQAQGYPVPNFRYAEPLMSIRNILTVATTYVIIMLCRTYRMGSSKIFETIQSKSVRIHGKREISAVVRGSSVSRANVQVCSENRRNQFCERLDNYIF